MPLASLFRAEFLHAGLRLGFLVHLGNGSSGLVPTLVPSACWLGLFHWMPLSSALPPGVSATMSSLLWSSGATATLSKEAFTLSALAFLSHLPTKENIFIFLWKLTSFTAPGLGLLGGRQHRCEEALLQGAITPWRTQGRAPKRFTRLLS